MTNPIRPTDNQARALAHKLLSQAGFAALAVVSDTGTPLVTRIAFGLSSVGQPISLVSSLSAHTQILKTNPKCSLLVGEPGPKGDPLTHPRLSLTGAVRFLQHGAPGYREMAAHYLHGHPKAKLYIDFTDFAFACFDIDAGYLNGGFGKAFHLTPVDMGFCG